MTDTLSTRATAPDRPLSGQRRRGWLRRLAGTIAYDVLLVPVGIQSIADAVTDEPREAVTRWQRLSRLLHPVQAATEHELRRGQSAAGGDEPGVARVFGYGLVSSVLGLVSWFLLFLMVTAVVRGPFWGFVEHGPVEPGTWGGPSRAGAWVTHAAVAIPSIVLFLAALTGLAALHAALVRRLDGRETARWVLPATIVVATGGLMFFWSWLQQL
ncbi:hypothetical protein AB0L70_39325 [Kribbella sp. NPDC051952]|uniref:hypothetical protein n=1 Tax=Kribbella sp. NPDC051952 TaxID=3154851 RepID=UPI00341AC053